MNHFRIKRSSISAIAIAASLTLFGLSQGARGSMASASGVAKFAAAPAAPEVAAIPTAFTYQGTLRLADGNLATGSYNITLKIYTQVISGTAVHTETFSNTVVRNGNFSVVVGDAVPITVGVFDNAALYLGITVAPDPEMLPRQRLFPVPWAMQASAAQTAVTAQTANTLAQNATGNGLTLNRGATNAPGLSLNSSSPGWGSGIQFANTVGNVTWGIYAGSDGNFHMDNVGGNQAGITMVNGGDIFAHRQLQTQSIVASGNMQASGNINAGAAIVAGTNIVASGKVYAAQGFNGFCRGSGPIDVRCDQDVAETFATDQRTEPGDLVVFIPEDREFPAVRLTGKPYEGAIVGVVSTSPGLVFDQGKTYLAGDNTNLITDKKTVVAMVGRVPTKFSLENGPIAIGDPLTSGSAPGTAMKATKAGQIIGYAMQSSSAAEAVKSGKLLLWLQLGMYIPQDTLSALNSVADLKAQVTALAAEVAALKAGK